MNAAWTLSKPLVSHTPSGSAPGGFSYALRGAHQIMAMPQIVWLTSQRICACLDMALGAAIRLKRARGLKEAFAEHVFSKKREEEGDSAPQNN